MTDRQVKGVVVQSYSHTVGLPARKDNTSLIGYLK